MYLLSKVCVKTVVLDVHTLCQSTNFSLLAIQYCFVVACVITLNVSNL